MQALPLTKGKKSGKANQNDKEELRKLKRARNTQNRHRSLKEQEMLKISTKAQNQHPP
jgi:hypothetical protein